MASSLNGMPTAAHVKALRDAGFEFSQLTREDWRCRYSAPQGSISITGDYEDVWITIKFADGESLEAFYAMDKQGAAIRGSLRHERVSAGRVQRVRALLPGL